MPRVIAILTAVVVLAGCTPESSDPSTDAATTAPVKTRASSDPPSPTPTREPFARVGCGRGYPKPWPERPRYRMDLQIRPAQGVAQGEMSVAFTPDLPTRRLVFRLWANGPYLQESGTRIDVRNVTIDGARTPTRSPDDTTLLVPLGRALSAGDTVEAALDFRLQLPGPAYDRISRRGESVRLGSFVPILAWVPGEGWRLTPPTTSRVETSVSPVADFDVTVDVPKEVDVLATGERSGRTWSAEAVRDFAVAIGDFTTVRATVPAPDPVRLTVGVDAGLASSPEQFLGLAEHSLIAHSERYGPYPWRSLNIAVVPDLRNSGIEYPMMLFLGENGLRTALSHEVGHQWFYSLVGNDQGVDPWLDEGLTTWTQARADDIMGYFQSLEIAPLARGSIGKPMIYWDDHIESYSSAAYILPVQTLASLNDHRAVDRALCEYVAQNAFGIAEPGDLRRVLRSELPAAERALGEEGAWSGGP